MNRTNKIANYHNLDLFEDKLKKHFRHTDIKVGSIHKFKGLEADIAIILECNQGVYPLIHPDNSLYSILGRNAKNILDEERRLFYVALTRGREQVYCISSKNKESDYLKDINLLLDLDDEIGKLIKELNNIFQ